MANFRKLLCSLFFLFVIKFSSFAQPGCPSINAGNDVTVDCTNPCVNLTSSCLATGATTTYTVSSIPYNPPYAYNTGTPILVNIDDTWSSAITIPFTFCFYGTPYTQIICGSNGVIGFNTSYSGGFCPWSYSVTCPNANILNSDTGPYVLGPYHDIDPSVSGQMYYAILGSYPCRTFIVSWYNVAMYSLSCNSMHATHMIVLYESTNVVEVYIQNKPLCTSWNGGRAVVGIQNADGTQGIAAPGRNTSQWTASNEAWRFTPAGSPNYTLTWWQGGTQIGTGASVNVCPTTNTTYTAQILYDCCVGNDVTITDDINVNVNSSAVISVAPLTSAICEGQSTTLNASGGISYSWSPATGLNTTSGPTVIASPTITTTYTLTGIADNGCTSQIPVTVNVNPNPTPTVTPSNPSICPGGSVVLTGNGADSYTWTPGTNLSCTSCISPTASPSQNTTYTVTGVSSAGCSGTTSVTVIINSVPTVTVTPPAPSICLGSSVGLTANGASTYTWAPSTSLSCTSCPDPTANPASQTTYTVTGTSAAGCTESTTVTVSISPNLVIGVTPASPAICSGNSVQLTANGGSTYNWAPSSGLSCINCPNPTANPTSQTTYTVTGTSTAGCTGSTTVTVSINPNPTATVPSNITVCNNGVVAATSFTSTPAGGTYTWSNSNTAIGLGASGSGNIPSFTATNSSSSPITVTITVTPSLNGCTGTPSAYTITVNPTPSSDFSVSSPNCTENTATISYNGFSFAGATYTWTFSGGTAVPGSGQGPQQVTWTSPGTYSVTLVVTENNCVSTLTSHNVLVSNISTTSPSHTNVICNGESNGTATVYPINGSLPYTYHWNTSPVQTTQTATNLHAGAYIVSITDINGCATVDTVVVYQPQPLAIDITYENEGCQNSCDGSVSAAITGGITPYTYHWSGSSLHTSTITNLCTGTYNVTVTDSNNCTITGSATIITDSPITADAIVSPSDSALVQTTINFTSTGIGAVDYSWNFGDGTQSNIPNPSHQYQNEGTYDVVLIVSTGAPDFCTDTFHLTIYIFLPPEVNIPNVFTPNGDGVNETFRVESKGLLTEEMTIYNRWGKKIFSWNELGGEWNGNNENGQKSADGVYYYIYVGTGKYESNTINRNGTVTLLR